MPAYEVKRSSSKLAIGSANFGMDYGATNPQGQLSNQSIQTILKKAFDSNITTIDTAAAYGNSEEALGKAIKADQDFQIITKLAPSQMFTEKSFDIGRISNRFQASLRQLNHSHIDGLLIHNCNDLFSDQGDQLYALLLNLKQQGLTSKIGVSIYEAEDIQRVNEHFDIDIIQAPINIADQRLILDGNLSALTKKGIEVHCRSAFLQGILLSPIERIPTYFTPILPQIKKLHQFCKNNQISLLEATLGFLKQSADIDKIIIGVNGSEQLQDCIAAESNDLSLDFSSLHINESSYLDPRNWTLS
ncbi:MAG: aldo/keto reductase [Pseudomonadales bacterium]|nr:aldo/keto reductase [Pseudomonadales bacterium]